MATTILFAFTTLPCASGCSKLHEALGAPQTFTMLFTLSKHATPDAADNLENVNLVKRCESSCLTGQHCRWTRSANGAIKWPSSPQYDFISVPSVIYTRNGHPVYRVRPTGFIPGIAGLLHFICSARVLNEYHEILF